jgi:predicted small lipoprotein YifL
MIPSTHRTTSTMLAIAAIAMMLAGCGRAITLL